MPKTPKPVIPKSLQNALVCFYRLSTDKNGPRPTYKVLAKAIDSSETFARHCLEHLAEDGRRFVYKREDERYAPYRLTDAGLKLAETLAKAKKPAKK